MQIIGTVPIAYPYMVSILYFSLILSELTGNCDFHACLLPMSTIVPDFAALINGRTVFVTLIAAKKLIWNALWYPVALRAVPAVNIWPWITTPDGIHTQSLQ